NPPEDVPLADLAREVIGLLAGPIAHCGVTVTIADNLPVVRGDRVRLLEVMQNLVDNAIKFLGAQSEPQIEIGVRRGDDSQVCFVRDNGVGVAPPYHDKIFGLFEQLDPRAGGTGIGLALVKRIIEVHGGKVWVESGGPGRGATFCFTLPTAAPVGASPEAP